MSIPVTHYHNLLCDRHLAATQPIPPGVIIPHAHSNGALAIYGLTIILMGGAAIQHFSVRLPVPYTVLLLLFGIVLGLWDVYDPNFTLQPGMKAGEHSWVRPGLPDAVLQCNVTMYVPNDLHWGGSHFGNAVDLLTSMDPHLLLHVMLPPLLFESAFAIDWHIFSKVAPFALLLALPGLIACSLCTGAMYMHLYGWSWEGGMLLGSILSATDPVAVVALLREMGVKKSLATLIEAESLLNDGTAVVVYSILLNAVEAGGLGAWVRLCNVHSVWHLIWLTIRMSILGPMFGAVLGVLSVKWLQANQAADRDANVEVIVTLAMPFLVFYLAETAFAPDMQMSGVLSVVCFGLVFASPFGRVRVDPRLMHFLHEFWGMMGHLVNTVLFTVAGMIIITSVVEQAQLSLAGDGSGRQFPLIDDVLYGLAMYAMMTLFRAAVMFGAIPLFCHGHYGYSWREAIVISWGGLRGAVGLALAMAIYNDGAITSPAARFMFGDSPGDRVPPAAAGIHFQQVVLLHVSMTVVLTLLVNAPSSGVILKMIGLTRLSDDRVSMLRVAHEELRQEALAIKRERCEDPIHADAHWPTVERLAGFDKMVAKLLGPSARPEDARPWADASLGAAGHAGAHHDTHHGGGTAADGLSSHAPRRLVERGHRQGEASE